MKQPSLRFLFAHPAHFLALGFGSGLARKAPGTWGTLAAFPVYFVMMWLPGTVYWFLSGLFVLAGVWICDVTGKALGVHDHGGIVWDEIAAFLLVLPFAPATWWGYLLAFALFRLFDIWKPFPIGWLDAQVQGGLGVMLDDLLAAGYAIAVLWGIRLWG
ncbi:MAG: phosphatidylglycerophosphatase A [Parasulfuritortus sp.]|jgi:phosphatidylglycerophosphatase A|nr:phosphatidylglycerophosphatase A [Parasulfuritortus sp.]